MEKKHPGLRRHASAFSDSFAVEDSFAGSVARITFASRCSIVGCSFAGLAAGSDQGGAVFSTASGVSSVSGGRDSKAAVLRTEAEFVFGAVLGLR
jgi:hypothetical protein